MSFALDVLYHARHLLEKKLKEEGTGAYLFHPLRQENVHAIGIGFVTDPQYFGLATIFMYCRRWSANCTRPMMRSGWVQGITTPPPNKADALTVAIVLHDFLLFLFRKSLSKLPLHLQRRRLLSKYPPSLSLVNPKSATNFIQLVCALRLTCMTKYHT